MSNKLEPPPRFDEVYRQGVRNMRELEGRINHIEKIREGMGLIPLVIHAGRSIMTFLGKDDTGKILEYLHSQGVVIKVDRELPKCWFDRGVDGYTSQHYIPSGLREALEEDGIVAVEPLIKEE